MRPAAGGTLPARRRRTAAVAAAAPAAAQHAPQLLAEVAAAAAAAQGAPLAALGAALVLVAASVVAVRSFNGGSRTYKDGENTVGNEYDAWTEEGVLEYYWGEHIHLGYYEPEELRGDFWPPKRDFIEAKFTFVDKMFDWGWEGPATGPKRILDVGCGVGGTSRHLAKRFPDAEVVGITLSPKQVQRATELAAEQGVTNARFEVMNALDMTWASDQFDMVWGCESGEHMPDKEAYIKEMTRVLKPGGSLVVATWCQRDLAEGETFTDKEKTQLQFLYDEWAHPYFISYEEYGRIMERTGVLASVRAANWVRETINSWRHSIWVGVFDPWIVVFKGPRMWWKVIREIVTLERMHRAFDCGLMTYGMIRSSKEKPSGQKGGATRRLEPRAA